jgi:hypothetical protein
MAGAAVGMLMTSYLLWAALRVSDGGSLKKTIRRKLIVGYMVAGAICAISLVVSKELAEPVVFGSFNFLTALVLTAGEAGQPAA